MNKYYRWLMAIALGLGLSAYSVSIQKPIDRASLRAIAADETKAERTLLVWKIGELGTENLPDTDVPSELRQRAKALNYKIDVEAISARSVTAKLREAIKQNRQPDILTYGDRGIIEGLQTDSEKFAGLYSIAGVKESSVFVNSTLRSLKANAILLNTSHNHDVARQLALPEIGCGETVDNRLIDNVDREAIEDFALQYGRTLFSESKTEFKNYLSESAIVGLSPGDLTGLPQKDIKICSIFANQSLAAVLTTVAHDGRRTVGHIDMLMVLLRENGSWRLLSQQLAGTNEGASPYLARLADAITNDVQVAPPQSATNLSAEKPKPKTNKEFEFKWQPSQSEEVVAEIVEFAQGVNARLFVRFREDYPTLEDSISRDKLYRTNQDKWRWRVWSIAADGSVTFSETETFQD